ncbi:hypothetical protein HBB16_19985 [Pseudonocardia sp. MCCB 268]|nr:hypothetical protein [Pseudonocardia cytotoxica]
MNACRPARRHPADRRSSARTRPQRGLPVLIPQRQRRRAGGDRRSVPVPGQRRASYVTGTSLVVDGGWGDLELLRPAPAAHGDT